MTNIIVIQIVTNCPATGMNWSQNQTFLILAFSNHAPRVVKRDEGFPWLYACFFKHAIQTDMPAYCSEYK
jgi:hypothetical protein